ncbi:hypothetical protein AW27_023530 [Streptomyces sp. PCS3-D2]|uniref:hypothetical protein n=1 Tax=Streptomyces sp. PCS3-D2 TaxID=1460244 RepID=UPI00044DC48B|nr:hypothetical protein [Streptomyces sp. PCS3-D2]WKV74216.1 hypothetical protein AW27_023530 [Streptomyces sp. PCS3-D2]
MAHGLMTELQIGGVWTPIQASVYARSPLVVERGRRDEDAVVGPSRARLQLDNRDGRHSPGNPRSANYGLFGRNAPIRFSVPGESYLDLTGLSPDLISTPDHASLDITGDIDLRIEATVDWASTTPTILMGKWSATTGQRSYRLSINSNYLQLVWTTDGTTTAFAQAPLPSTIPARAAVRGALDVNDGTGGWTAHLYWARTMDGPWTELLEGDQLSGTGVTSIHSGTSALQIAPTSGSVLPMAGRVHRAEVRDGIAGTVVASPDFRAQPAGTTSFADGAGRTWTIAGDAAIRDRWYRLHAEVSSWPARWDVSGRDVYVPIEAAGILRRLGQGQKALASTLARRLPSQGPVAYWPMEEGRDAVQAYSPLVGCAPLTTPGFSFGQDDSCPGSAALPSLGAAAIMAGAVPEYTSTGNGYLISLVFQLDAPSGSKQPWLSFRTTGTAAGIVISYTAGTIEIDGYDSSSALIWNESFGNSDTYGPGRWWRFDFSAQQNGGNVDYHAGWVEVDGVGSAWNWSEAGTVGTVEEFDTAFGAAFSGMKIGHLTVFPSSDLGVWGGSDNGYGGEPADVRLNRLGAEEGVGIRTHGGSTPLGAQRPNSLLSLFGECEAADGGVLFEDRERLALVYRSRESLYTQPVALTLDYEADGHVSPPLEPIDDDQRIRNDRTITRTGGSSARAVDETSALSVLPPPLGVGPYDDSRTLNLRADSQVEQIAAWALHLGTWDEPRYPTVHINLAAAPSLIPAVLALDIGDRIQIVNPPAWLPPGPIDLLVEGYTEAFGHPNSWDIVLNCSPAGPWNVAVVEDPVYGRADTTGSVLGADATDSATTLVVHTEQTAVAWSRERWPQDPAQYPMDLRVDGEVVTASAATSLAEDDFTRTVAAGGWGLAADGHAWTLNGGVSNNERSVASNRGVVTVTSSQTLHRQQTVSETCQDADVRCQMAVSATATGGNLTGCVLLRWTSTTAHYRARLEFTTGGAINVSVTNGSTIIGTNEATGLTYSPGDTFEVRVRIIGYRVLMRVWRTGTTEPILWHIDRTDVSATNPAGAIGLSCHGGTGNTNTGVEYRFDNFLVESPQRITVTRAVNDVTKSHAAGERIRLAQPARAAL